MDNHAETLIARLRDNPQDVDAFSELRQLYQSLHDWASLCNLVEGWASHADDPQEAAAAYTDAGQLALNQLADPSRAVQCFEQALVINPFHYEAIDPMVHASLQKGAPRRLVETLASRIHSLKRLDAEPQFVAGANLHLGELLEHALGDEGGALAHYRMAFEADPAAVPAIYGAREILRRRGDLHGAAQLFDLEAEQEQDPARKLALLREAAHMRRKDMGDVHAAVAVMQRAEQLSPDNPAILKDLAELLLERANHTADSARADRDRSHAASLLVRVARGANETAATEFLEAALDACPGHDEALAALEKLAEKTGYKDGLPLRWVHYLQSNPDGGSSSDVRKRLVRAYLEAGQLSDAIVCLEPLLKLRDMDAAAQLVDLYRQADREFDRFKALRVATANLSDREKAVRFLDGLERLVNLGQADEVSLIAQEVLELDPANEQTIAQLRLHYRKHGDIPALRASLEKAADATDTPPKRRKRYLLECADLSLELDDPDGAVAALRAIRVTEPNDVEVTVRLEALLADQLRWKELTELLEAQYAEAEREARIELARRLAELYFGPAEEPEAGVDALRRVRVDAPQDDAALEQLCEALLSNQAYLEALPLLRERANRAQDDQTRLALLQRLAAIQEEHIKDEEGAYETRETIFELTPNDLANLERMESIVHEMADGERLITVLARQADVYDDASAKAKLAARKGDVAEVTLGDPARAMAYYREALDLAPGSISILDKTVELHVQGRAQAALTETLKAQLDRPAPPAVHGPIRLRLARTLEQMPDRRDEALETWREVARGDDDPEALGKLREHLGQRGLYDELEGVLARLARVTTNSDERDALLLERAVVLLRELGRNEDAKALLMALQSGTMEGESRVLAPLVDACRATNDPEGLAQALTRWAAHLEDDALVEVAKELADVSEHRLHDPVQTRRALQMWADAALTDPVPFRRLIALLEKGDDILALIDALDALAGIEQDDDVASDLVRRAARLSIERLGDVDGAWTRLEERFRDGDKKAEQELRSLAQEVARGETLAELYGEVAQNAVPEQKKAYFLKAAEILEGYVEQPGKALEAVLRAFAVDMSDDALLDEVDRLGAKSQKYARIAQVYDTLLRDAAEDRRTALLMRHARWIWTHSKHPSDAFDRVIRVASQDPYHEEALAMLEDLAPRCNRVEELVMVYDRRRDKALDTRGRIDAMLRAAELCDVALSDRERGLRYLAQAAQLAAPDVPLLDAVEETASRIDQAHAAKGSASIRRALTKVYRRLSERLAQSAPREGAEMLMRTAYLHEADLEEAAEALQCMKEASALAPNWAEALDKLEQQARAAGELEELNGHLAFLVEESLDSATAAALLKRRALLLSDMSEFGRAADVYKQLLTLQPENDWAEEGLRESFQRSGRYQDLLLVLDRRLKRTEGQARIDLLKEMAELWEVRLSNRWEALDLWKRVLREAPSDEEAQASITRLKRTSAPDAEWAEASAELLRPGGRAASGKDRRTQLDDDSLSDQPTQVRSSEAPDDGAATLDDARTLRAALEAAENPGIATLFREAEFSDAVRIARTSESPDGGNGEARPQDAVPTDPRTDVTPSDEMTAPGQDAAREEPDDSDPDDTLMGESPFAASSLPPSLTTSAPEPARGLGADDVFVSSPSADLGLVPEGPADPDVADDAASVMNVLSDEFSVVGQATDPDSASTDIHAGRRPPSEATATSAEVPTAKHGGAGSVAPPLPRRANPVPPATRAPAPAAPRIDTATDASEATTGPMPAPSEPPAVQAMVPAPASRAPAEAPIEPTEELDLASGHLSILSAPVGQRPESAPPPPPSPARKQPSLPPPAPALEGPAPRKTNVPPPPAALSRPPRPRSSEVPPALTREPSFAALEAESSDAISLASLTDLARDKSDAAGREPSMILDADDLLEASDEQPALPRQTSLPPPPPGQSRKSTAPPLPPTQPKKPTLPPPPPLTSVRPSAPPPPPPTSVRPSAPPPLPTPTRASTSSSPNGGRPDAQPKAARKAKGRNKKRS